MRTDPGGFWTIISGQHFIPIYQLQLNSGSGWVDYTDRVMALNYSASISDAYGPGALLGASSRTEITVDLDSTANIYDWAARVLFSFVPLNNYVTVFEGKVAGVSITDNSVTHFTATDYAISKGLQSRQSTRLLEGYRVDQLISYLCSLIGLTLVVVEPSTITIPLFWLDDETVLDQILRLAKLDGGCFYMDGTTAYYRSGSSWSGPTGGSSGWNLSWQTDFVSKEINYSLLNKYTKVQVNKRVFERGKVATVYSMSRPYRIPGNSSRMLRIRFSSPCWVNGPLWVWAINYAHSDPAGISCTLYYDGYTDPMTAARNGVSSGKVKANGWDLELTNPNSFDAFLLKFKIMAVPVVSAPLEDEEKGTTDDRVFQVSDSDLIQSEYYAKAIQELFYYRFIAQANTRPTIRLTGVKPNPLLQVGDVITVDGDKVLVTGISWSTPRCDMVVEGLYMGDFYSANGYFVIGTTPLGSTTYRMYY